MQVDIVPVLKTGVMLVGKIPLHETKFSDDKTDCLTGPCFVASIDHFV